jgi:hypothetical protein
MPERIKVAEYQKRPIEEVEFPDGTVWTVRQPLDEDYFRRQEVVDAHRERVITKAKELATKATAKAEETGGDDEARALIDKEADEETLPLKFTLRYMQASILALFITPEQKPKTILEMLPPDLMHYLNARVDEVLLGEAAKKRVRADQSG